MRLVKIAGPVGRVAQLVNLVGPLVWWSALLVRSLRCPSVRYAARQFVNAARQFVNAVRQFVKLPVSSFVRLRCGVGNDFEECLFVLEKCIFTC
jgi:hypothetical protein